MINYRQTKEEIKEVINEKINENYGYFQEKKQDLANKAYPTLRKMVQEQFGYPFEKHTYQTEDGYINSVYRIAGPKGTTPKLGKKTGKKIVIY